MLLDMNTPTPSVVAGRPRGGGRFLPLVRAFGPIAKPFAGTRVFPLWAILRHSGRTSGKAYATPIVALRTKDGFLIPLPFGDRTQWLKNLQAADRASLRHVGHEYVIDRPEVVDLRAAGADLPAPIRFASGRIGINHFVRVHRVDDR